MNGLRLCGIGLGWKGEDAERRQSMTPINREEPDASEPSVPITVICYPPYHLIETTIARDLQELMAPAP
jgi:hypothetical protein